MIHQPAYVKELIRKYLEGSATEVEMVRLQAAWKLFEDEELLQMLEAVLLNSDYSTNDDPLAAWTPSAKEVIERARKATWIVRLHKTSILLKKAGMYLLPFFLIAGLALWRINRSATSATVCNTTETNGEIPTANFACTITLANDGVLQIDSNFSGMTKTTTVGGIFSQPTPGLLQYQNPRHGPFADSASTVYYTIRIPKKQQYRLQLEDGSRVRLNASTVLRFPASFAPGKRIVELDGEAYFEVAPKETPFLIITPYARIETTTAICNINTNFTRTVAAVEQGRLLVSNNSDSLMMRCYGDVALVTKAASATKSGKDTIVYFKEQEMRQVLTWKNAQRVYHQVYLRYFVADICRWYGLQLENLNCIPEKTINAKICYQASLEEALAIFRQKGLTIHLAGDRISFCDPYRDKLTAPVKETLYASRKQ